MERTMIETLEDALYYAKKCERETGRYHYVVKWFDGTHEVTERMPMLGTWWDADGIRHG